MGKSHSRDRQVLCVQGEYESHGLRRGVLADTPRETQGLEAG